MINLGHLTALALNGVFFLGVINANEPMQLNHRAMLSVFEAFPWAVQRLESGLASFNDRIESSHATAEKITPLENDFCTPEFEAVSLTDVAQLPSSRTVQQVKKTLGRPCREDGENIYYATDSNEVIYFNKSTGKGGFQS